MGLRDDIKYTLEYKKMSVAKLARLTDIHQDTIYNFLNGKSQMTADNLDKIIEVLKSK